QEPTKIIGLDGRYRIIRQRLADGRFDDRAVLVRGGEGVFKFVLFVLKFATLASNLTGIEPDELRVLRDDRTRVVATHGDQRRAFFSPKRPVIPVLVSVTNPIERQEADGRVDQ